MKLDAAIDMLCAGEVRELAFVKCDRMRNTAGAVKEIVNPRVTGSSHDAKAHRTIGIKDGDKTITVHTGLIMRINNEFVQ